MNNKIYVVIVTYNRLDKLKKALSCYTSQSYLPSRIIVIDNCSTDGTSEYLKEWETDNKSVDKTVIRTERNLGGAGGFKIGMQTALSMDPDWVWISDDDAYPQKDALQIVNDNIGKKEYGNVACFCGAVYERSFDNIGFQHRRNSEKKKGVYVPSPVKTEDYQRDFLYIEETTFVGSCYNAEALRKAGPPNDSFFIYYDDTEHSHRVNKQGKIVLLPKCKILHDTASKKSDPNVISTWRDYYFVRNHVYTLKEYHKLTYAVYCCYKIYKIIMAYKKNRNKDALKLNLTALSDGIHARLGIHNLYAPGFEIKKKSVG